MANIMSDSDKILLLDSIKTHESILKELKTFKAKFFKTSTYNLDDDYGREKFIDEYLLKDWKWSYIYRFGISSLHEENVERLAFFLSTMNSVSANRTRFTTDLGQDEPREIAYSLDEWGKKAYNNNKTVKESFAFAKQKEGSSKVKEENLLQAMVQNDDVYINNILEKVEDPNYSFDNSTLKVIVKEVVQSNEQKQEEIQEIVEPIKTEGEILTEIPDYNWKKESFSFEEIMNFDADGLRTYYSTLGKKISEIEIDPTIKDTKKIEEAKKARAALLDSFNRNTTPYINILTSLKKQFEDSEKQKANGREGLTYSKSLDLQAIFNNTYSTLSRVADYRTTTKVETLQAIDKAFEKVEETENQKKERQTKLNEYINVLTTNKTDKTPISLEKHIEMVNFIGQCERNYNEEVYTKPAMKNIKVNDKAKEVLSDSFKYMGYMAAYMLASPFSVVGLLCIPGIVLAGVVAVGATITKEITAGVKAAHEKAKKSGYLFDKIDNTKFAQTKAEAWKEKVDKKAAKAEKPKDKKPTDKPKAKLADKPKDKESKAKDKKPTDKPKDKKPSDKLKDKKPSDKPKEKSDDKSKDKKPGKKEDKLNKKDSEKEITKERIDMANKFESDLLNMTTRLDFYATVDPKSKKIQPKLKPGSKEQEAAQKYILTNFSRYTQELMENAQDVLAKLEALKVKRGTKEAKAEEKYQRELLKGVLGKTTPKEVKAIPTTQRESEVFHMLNSYADDLKAYKTLVEKLSALKILNKDQKKSADIFTAIVAEDKASPKDKKILVENIATAVKEKEPLVKVCDEITKKWAKVKKPVKCTIISTLASKIFNKEGRAETKQKKAEERQNKAAERAASVAAEKKKRREEGEEIKALINDMPGRDGEHSR